MTTHPIQKVILVFVVLVMASCGRFASGPGAAYKSFYKDIESGKTEQAAERVTGPGAQMLGSEKLKAAFAQESIEMKQKGGIKSIETSERVQGNTAVVVARITYGDGSTEVRKDKLIKSDNGWMVSADIG